MQLRHEADHSPPSSAEVKKKKMKEEEEEKMNKEEEEVEEVEVVAVIKCYIQFWTWMDFLALFNWLRCVNLPVNGSIRTEI